MKHLNNISNEGILIFNLDIVELNIPTAIPLVYEFDENMNVLKHSYLADPEELEALINKVKKQTEAKWSGIMIVRWMISIFRKISIITLFWSWYGLGQIYKIRNINYILKEVIKRSVIS